MFVDPRTARPPAPQCALADESDDIKPLARLCREGRLYAVEEWISAGNPLWTTKPPVGKGRVESPLRIAIDTSQYDLALLLLCNGFPPDVDVLTHALYKKAPAFVDLLLTWGAKPCDADAYAVLDTYDAELYDRFWTAGFDFTRNHTLARMLADQSSNRPAYGWARRHNNNPKIARELAIGLLQAVVENRERAVAMLMWAGADPRKPVPDLRYARDDEVEEDDVFSTAMVHALMYGHGHLLKTLKPHPTRDNFDVLWRWAFDEAAVDYLAERQRPSDWSKVLVHNLERALSRYQGDAARKLIEKLTLEYDARVTTMSDSEIANFRREILRSTDESRSRWVMRWLSYEETCDPAVFQELTRTASMQRKVNSLHIRDARYRY